jgi:hypothetical protein
VNQPIKLKGTSMTLTYTNRKGTTYYLCKSISKKGSLRYYFSPQPKGEPVEEIPEGYEIRENVNGQVSIGRSRPKHIHAHELETIQNALELHPEGSIYRAEIKDKDILIYEPLGPSSDQLIEIFGSALPISEEIRNNLENHHAKQVQYTPVLRFALIDTEERQFQLYRMGYSGKGGWQDVFMYGSLSELAEKAIPTLGTDAFFELGGF